MAIASGCAVLPATAPSPPVRGETSTRTVSCVTRTLADGMHLQVLEQRVTTAEPELVAFLDANPGLDGRLSLVDFLFLERLFESKHRPPALELRADPEPTALDMDSELARGPPDSLDAVWRLKIGLIRDALGFPSFLSEVSRAIGEDALDPASEHGGLVLLSNADGCPLRLLALPSVYSGDDFAYGLPPELFTASCLAFWHNHQIGDRGLTTGPGGADRATGPSGALGPSLASAWGDRWIAYLKGIDGLIFTPGEEGAFMVVFYGHEGEIRDLGTYRPP
jgi:hypothetical protein